MKKIVVALSLLAVFACKNKEEQNDEPGIMDAVESVKSMNKGADAIKDYEKITEDLKKLTPVKNDVYKAVLVETLGDLPRTKFSAGNNAAAAGLSTAEATYSNAEGKAVKVTIFDGAGETGSALITILHMTIAMGMESIEGTKTMQTEEIDGNMCSTQNDTNPDSYNNSSINFIYNDRFQITLEGTKIQLEELKSYLAKLDLSHLK
ncbi:hypothetical protein FFWV33_00940 [Flavobacterium faecale]|uniref:Uncharacterized protein n=1 Tax=Flavobacterium faecale TaxID=1355330 RepID=A0A2S1L8V9_9FLAO|nr:hypothetical protein [Flavobacterium faecale]AWG20189.1 hypothetical protein FFWV33_00940 [Flavobacterium faecale]